MIEFDINHIIMIYFFFLFMKKAILYLSIKRFYHFFNFTFFLLLLFPTFIFQYITHVFI